MKYLIIWIIMFSVQFSVNGQEKENIFYLLKSGTYTKVDLTKMTKRVDTTYSFTIPCNCKPQFLHFYYNSNPKSGKVNPRIYKISKKAFKKIRFVTLDTLIEIMKKNTSGFNNKFNLQLVEPGKVITVFPVFTFTSFGDYADDRIGP